MLAGTVRVLDDSSSAWLAAEGAHGAAYRAIEFRSGNLGISTVGDAAPGPAYAVIRAEEIVLALDASASSVRNSFVGVVEEIATLGALTRVTVQVDGTPLVAALTTRSAHELDLRVGIRVHASFKAMAVHLC